MNDRDYVQEPLAEPNGGNKLKPVALAEALALLVKSSSPISQENLKKGLAN